MQRRAFLAAATGVTGAGGVVPAAGQDLFRVTKGRLKQSIVHWCFTREPRPWTIGDSADAAVKLGMGSVELIGPEHWPLLKTRGLTCAIAGSHGFAKGFAHTDEHDECIASLRRSIDACVAHGVKRVITFSGFRRDLDDATAMTNMLDGLKKILPYAEEKKVALCLEMLNSRVAEDMRGHPDYWCDHIGMALEICRRLGSPQMKLLFDIYHVQIMDGDVIRRMRECREFIGHVHTAGNPGREELDDTQEIHYPGVMRALTELKYDGFVGQEFIPRNPDKLQSLSEAVRICDV